VESWSVCLWRKVEKPALFVCSMFCSTFSSGLTFETFASADMESWCLCLREMLEQSALLICSSQLLSPGWLLRILRLWRWNLDVCVWGNILESKRYWYIPTALTFPLQEKKKKIYYRKKGKKLGTSALLVCSVVVLVVTWLLRILTSPISPTLPVAPRLNQLPNLSDVTLFMWDMTHMYMHIYIHTHGFLEVPCKPRQSGARNMRTVYVHIPIYVYIYSYKCVCIYTNIYINIYIYMYV